MNVVNEISKQSLDTSQNTSVSDLIKDLSSKNADLDEALKVLVDTANKVASLLVTVSELANTQEDQTMKSKTNQSSFINLYAAYSQIANSTKLIQQVKQRLSDVNKK